MNINEFFSELIDSDCELRNMAFNENIDEFTDSINNFKSKLAIAISSSFFNKNIQELSNIGNNLSSIISLPIFHEDSNILLIVLESNKQSDEVILIDESDSLIHKNDDDNWFFIEDNIAEELISSINNFEDSGNALKVGINQIFVDVESYDDIDEHEKDEYSEFLDIKRTKQHKAKKKVITDVLLEEILDLKEAKATKMQKTNVATSLNELLYSKNRQNPENYLRKNNKPLIEGNVEFHKLGEIADLKNINEKNGKNTILVDTCKQCSSKLVYYNYDIETFNDQIFVEISNISDNVLMDYLYEYLNSDNGKNELQYFSKGNNYLRAEFIKSIKIPVPSKEVQNDIVKASREAREFFKTVDLLKNEFNSNIFDYKHTLNSIRELKGKIEFDSETNEITDLSRSWRHAFQGLIWPLAISYLSATKGGFETVEKKDNYIILFEFIAAFNSIILLSGLPNDVYQKHFYDIWTAKPLTAYGQMTFGKWVYVLKNLAKVYRENNFTSKLDEKLFERITSKKILNILQNTQYLRNDESHGSMTTVYDAEYILEILDNYLEDLFDILEVYSNYKLIYNTGSLQMLDEGFDHRVILLNGPCAQPIYDNLIFDEPLKGSLYLYNPINNKKLEIKDNLMKFLPTDEYNKHWALFLYYSCDRKQFNAFYKCFQSKEDDQKFSINSLESDILGHE